MKSPKGGKALQRLLSYLGERDLELIPETVPVDVPAASQPKVGGVRRALKARPAAPRRARSARTARAAGRRRAPAASKAYASSLTRAV